MRMRELRVARARSSLRSHDPGVATAVVTLAPITPLIGLYTRAHGEALGGIRRNTRLGNTSNQQQGNNPHDQRR
jgi:hypothetical protein